MNKSNHNNFNLNHKTNTQSYPKGFNNIFISNVTKKNNYPVSFGLVPQNTKTIKNQVDKKIITNQSHIKSNGDKKNQHHYSSSKEKVKMNIKNSKSLSNKTHHSNNGLKNASNYTKNKHNKPAILKEIENIISSNQIGINRQSRNKGKDSNTLSKSKTNQSECKSNLNQMNLNNNLLTQTQIINLNSMKQNKTIFNLQSQNIKTNSSVSKPGPYLDMKMNFKPMKAIIPNSMKQNIVKTKSLIYSNINIKESIKPPIAKMNSNDNFFNYPYNKHYKDDKSINMKFNSPHKVNGKYLKSTSATSHHLSSVNVPKNSS